MGSFFGADTINSGKVKCGLCGVSYPHVDYIHFAGMQVAECCFGKIEDSIIQHMPDILSWFKSIMDSNRKILEEREWKLSSLEESIGKYEFMERKKFVLHSPIFTSLRGAVGHLDSLTYPVTIVAIGLGAGVGSILVDDKESAIAALDEIMEKKIFGCSGNRVALLGTS